MGYIITDAEKSLFGGYHIVAYINDDGTITDNSAGWRHILAHIESDGNVTDNSPGCHHILGHILGDS